MHFNLRDSVVGTGLGELAHLRRDALAVRRDSRVSVFHALIMAVTSAKEKPFLFSGLISLHNSSISGSAEIGNATCHRPRPCP
jgi:hypothetical protein